MASEQEIVSQVLSLSSDDLDTLLSRLSDEEKQALLDMMERNPGGSGSGSSSRPGGSGSGSSHGGGSGSSSSSRDRSKASTPRDEACEYLDRDGLKYSITSQGNISLCFTRDHKDDITVYVAVHDDYDIHMRTSDLVEFRPRQQDLALQVMSDLNTKYRYAKFCMDDDNTIHAEADLPGRKDGGDCFAVLAQFVRRIEIISREAMNDELTRLG